MHGCASDSSLMRAQLVLSVAGTTTSATPAWIARSSTAWLSGSNLSSSRCAWLSTILCMAFVRKGQGCEFDVKMKQGAS